MKICIKAIVITDLFLGKLIVKPKCACIKLGSWNLHFHKQIDYLNSINIL